MGTSTLFLTGQSSPSVVVSTHWILNIPNGLVSSLCIFKYVYKTDFNSLGCSGSLDINFRKPPVLQQFLSGEYLRPGKRRGHLLFPSGLYHGQCYFVGLKIGRQRYYPGEHTFGVYWWTNNDSLIFRLFSMALMVSYIKWAASCNIIVVVPTKFILVRGLDLERQCYHFVQRIMHERYRLVYHNRDIAFGDNFDDVICAVELPDSKLGHCDLVYSRRSGSCMNAPRPSHASLRMYLQTFWSIMGNDVCGVW